MTIGERLGAGISAWVHHATLTPKPLPHPEGFAAKLFRRLKDDSPSDAHEKHCVFEADLGLRVNSPYVSKTFGQGTFYNGENAFPFILKEFVPGCNFYDWCIKDLELEMDHPTRPSFFATMDTLKMARGLALGLKAFHDQGLLLIDLSIHNFICDLLGDQTPKLHDLGAATPMDTPSPFMAYDDAYTAPEVIDYLAAVQRSKSERKIASAWDRVGPTADLYSLGMVFFKLNAEKSEPRILALAKELAEQKRHLRPQSIEAVLNQL